MNMFRTLSTWFETSGRRLNWSGLSIFAASFVFIGIFHRKTLYLAATTGTRSKRRKKNGSVNIGAIFGMDVGGTLAKIVYFQPGVKTIGTTEPTLIKRQSSESLAQLASPDHQKALEQLYTYMDSNAAMNSQGSLVIRDDILSVYSTYLEGSLHFLHFETRNMIPAIHHLGNQAVTENIKSIGCTGGGAHKYAKTILEELDITIDKYDELGCLVRGMLFALLNFPDECYTYRNVDDDNTGHTPGIIDEDDDTDTAPHFDAEEEDDNGVPIQVKRWQKDSKSYTKKVILSLPSIQKTLPFLIVNIGSGVSILKVSSPGQFERISGTSLGGGTYWGLCRLLTKCSTFEEVLDLAESGDAGTVDMLVKDIYGGDYGNMLSGNMVASSFGKLVMKENPREHVREEDLALALLMMITNNIGQVAHLNAQLHDCPKIFFVGSFLRHNPISCRRLAFAIDFWSGGTMEALFSVHEGYFGALGTFLHRAFGDDVDRILSESQAQQEEDKRKAQHVVAPAVNAPPAGSTSSRHASPLVSLRKPLSLSARVEGEGGSGGVGVMRSARGRSTSDDMVIRGQQSPPVSLQYTRK